MMLWVLRGIAVLAIVTTVILVVVGGLVPSSVDLLRWVPLALVVSAVLVGVVLLVDRRRWERITTR